MSAHPLPEPYHVCATVNRRCLGMLLLRSILRREPGGISRRNHGWELGRHRFPWGLGLLVLQQVFPQGFHKILLTFSQGFGQCGLSTSGTVKVSGLVVCWAIFAVNFVHGSPGQRGCLASFQWLPRSGSRGEVRKAGRSQPLLVHSAACLSLGGDGAGSRGGERTPRRKPRERHPSSADPLRKAHRQLAGQRNMEEATASEGFVNATKQPAKLLELMRHQLLQRLLLMYIKGPGRRDARGG